jgi:hypothetical protein
MAIFRVNYIEPDGVTGTIIVDAANLAEARMKAASSSSLPPGAIVQGAPTSIGASEGIGEQTSIAGLFDTPEEGSIADRIRKGEDITFEVPEPEIKPPDRVYPPGLPPFWQERYDEYLNLSPYLQDVIIRDQVKDFIALQPYRGIAVEQDDGFNPEFRDVAEYLADEAASGNIDWDKVEISDDGTSLTFQPGFKIDDTEKERFLENISRFGAFARGLQGTPLEGFRERGGFARRFAESQYEPAYTSYLGSQILPFITGSGLSEGAAARLNTNDETLNTALRKRLSGATLNDTEAALLADYDSVSNQPQTFSAFTRQFLGQGPEATRRNLLDQFRQAAAMDQAATGIGREFTTPSSQETASQIEDFARAAFASQYSPIISGALQAALPTASFADYATKSMGFDGQPIEQPNFLKFIGSRYGLI